MDELQAIRRLKAGGFDGLEYLMLKYQVKAVRVAFLVLRDKTRAEDVVQEVFFRLFRRPGGFDESRPFEPYLMRSILNAALNVCRDEKKSISLEGSTALVEGLISRAAPVESQVEYAQIKSEILNAMDQLSPRQRAAIVQRYYLDMSEKEMAVALDAAPGTIKWLLNTARNNLRDVLKKERI